jgi:hypothetical protein
VHHGAPTPFINGFASNGGFGAIQQTQDIESLLR